MGEKENPVAAGGFPPTKEELPAYLQQNAQRVKANNRRKSFRRVLLVMLAVVLGAHLWTWQHARHATDFFMDDIEWEDGRPGHGHGHHGRPRHGRGHGLFGEKAEKYFLTIPNNDSCLAASRLYATIPHMAGTEGDLFTAKEWLYLLQRELAIPPPVNDPIFDAGSPESQDAIYSITKPPQRHWPHPHIPGHGHEHKQDYDTPHPPRPPPVNPRDAPRAWIDVYYPILNSPINASVQVVGKKGKVLWEADLKEHADEKDPEAAQYSDAVPTFHGLSKGGNVTGKLIHANYGLKDDYDKLVAKGVNFTGAVVLVRYGGNFRGLKVKGAQELGAVGVLIYSDPKDDGTVTIENGYKAYPYGPARNPKSVQRGSVQYLSMYPGDPTTPGYPSYENATRTEGENIPKIPSLPISWENAKALLDKLDEEGKDGEVRVNLVNNVDIKVTPIWNTMAVIPGFIKDEVVVVGNHRDAWVMGAGDPSSGTASLHETIRGLGALLKRGWKPLRTIVIASWDAEEYGLVGSTEWGEDFAEWIDKHVVAYLNLDGSVSGSRFSSQASPLLAHLVQGTALLVPHPTDPERTLWDARHDAGPFTAGAKCYVEEVDETRLNGEWVKTATVEDDLGVGVLGSGSDYTVFLQRIGVASMNHGFGSSKSDAVYHYHSVYDSEYWMENYGDPGFYKHVAVAKHLGLLTLRVAGQIILPFNTTHYTGELEKYFEKVDAIVKAQASDEDAVEVDLTPLRKSIKNLRAASLSLDYEKLKAEKKLKAAIKKWKKASKKARKWKWKIKKGICKLRRKIGLPCKKPKHPPPHGPPHRGPHGPHRPNEINGRKIRFGKPVAHAQEKAFAEMRKEVDILAGMAAYDGGVEGCKLRKMLRDIEMALHPDMDLDAESEQEQEQDRPKLPKLPHFPVKELREAVKAIRKVNSKLNAFERGFISEEGIIEREWFRHLGVAPGKWLGYGATTLPALTESITIEKNATMAKYEVKRLVKALDGIAETIKYRD